MEYVLFGLVILILDIYALRELSHSRTTSRQRGRWAVVILCLPVVGLVCWHMSGRRAVIIRI
ncbi:hypothetical protein EKE94_09785 [Mesobaculum littorinae]|uniref:Cardiolipin synthase N-terminal domain-containing protein n=1 Tax=Mesobaculum littorinae TaxID=2486419 RepID=A0A438AGD6_9RHOB|nr:PLDc N-terminal domain-containing protein [Mesobaculum littorinae]RVV97769.1 hypothetical protein EKE94_09785 [Mesobaculum littorinae]